jgi:hypothetical protein
VFPPDARLNPGPLSLACVIIQRNTSTSLFPAGKVDAPVQPKDSPLTPAHHHRYRHIRSAPARPDERSGLGTRRRPCAVGLGIHACVAWLRREEGGHDAAATGAALGPEE